MQIASRFPSLSGPSTIVAISLHGNVQNVTATVMVSPG